MSNMNELKKIDVLWSSNYTRAISTAKYIANNNNIEINVDEKLNERKLGNLNLLKELGKDKKYTFTEEQLLDENLKNFEGESRFEVNKRMNDILSEILQKNKGKRIAIVSHGAALKFLLMNWCELNEEIKLVYKRNVVLDLNSPCVIKLVFYENKLDKLSFVL